MPKPPKSPKSSAKGKQSRAKAVGLTLATTRIPVSTIASTVAATTTATTPAITPTVAAAGSVSTGISAGGIAQLPGGIAQIPGLFAPSSLTSLFDKSRPGKPVVRPSDLLALRIELVNLTVAAGTPPMMQRAAAGPAYIVLHFPPQSIAEEVFFETAAAGMDKPDTPPLPPGITPKPDPANTGVAPAPIRARVADESRLVFKVPDTFSAPYTLAGVLDACQSLSLNVPANALPQGAGGRFVVRPGPSISSSRLRRLSAAQRVSLAGLALRSAQLQTVEGASSTALAARISQLATPGVVLRPDRIPVFRFRPRPALPGAQETAIEMPWRLIIAPHAGEAFRHATQPVTSPVTQRTELWHSRMVAPDAKGGVIEPPRPDPARTFRAVWALTGEGSDPNAPMSGTFPTANDLPTTSHPTGPFLTALDDFDRFQITHLSSNFTISNYLPNALDANLLMLSALGGWLDSRGGWDPPGLSVEEWVHRASMGRDHYVRVVYKGFLYPFGHRVALVKVSERKFHNGRNNTPALPGNPAYLRQRMFIVVREKDRPYVDPSLTSADGKRNFQRQLPFNNVRILTAVTPNLDQPTSPAAAIARPPYDPKGGDPNFGQSMFWPCVNGAPFRFRCVGTDIDGRKVQFELPLIFMDNSLASPRNRQGSKLVPDFASAELHARAATDEWLARTDGLEPRRTAELKRQRVALAPSVKSGDTAVEVEKLEIGGEWQAQGSGLRSYSQNLSRPVFYPSVITTRVRIAALSQLTGSGANNLLKWNAAYLQNGFDAPDVPPSSAKNKSQVFAEVVAEGGMAQLDFSTQGDRSGGFVMPNLKPSGLSRSLGPVTGPIDKLVSGADLSGTEMFPSSLSDLPLPLLFGCIPLGEILQAIAGGSDKLPKFASEATSKLEAFFNTLARAYAFVQQIGSQSGSLAQAAIDVVKGIADDLLAQAKSLAAAEVAQVKNAINTVKTRLDALRARFDDFVKEASDGSLPSIDQIAAALTPANTTQLSQKVDDAIAALNDLSTQVKAATLPSGFQQSALSAVSKATGFLTDVKTVLQLVTTGKALFDAFKAVVEDPSVFTTPGVLGPKLDTVKTAIDPLRNTVAGFHLLDGAPRKAIVDVLDAVSEVLGVAADLTQILDNLLGDELVIRFDWKPAIDNWALPGADKNKDPIFRANDKHGFIVGVEAKVKKSGGTPKVTVLCGLNHFDLVLIAPAAFLELNFEKIEFTVDSSAKMNVDVLLSDIKFVGPLSFVETLKDLIPLDGLSDPPYLDISTKGIDAGFDLALPNIAVGMFSLTNLSLGAGFTVPFIGQPLSVRFNFCTREQPFNLTVSLFGGGGFFGVTIDPHGVQILEAAFEFGASISVDFGVASGGVSVMAGVYFRMEKDAASLTGYFRLAGHVSVLGIISASLELYLELRYEFQSGKCVGKAELTIEVSIFMFSVSVKITCERKFAGSNGDPSFRDLMGANPALALQDELNGIDNNTQYAWRQYCEAFA